jgi:hypothetical protein
MVLSKDISRDGPGDIPSNAVGRDFKQLSGKMRRKSLLDAKSLDR